MMLCVRAHSTMQGRVYPVFYMGIHVASLSDCTWGEDVNFKYSLMVAVSYVNAYYLGSKCV